MNKYHNIKCVVDGITFHSRKEGERYKQLKLLERAGQIKNLILQPKFILLEDVLVYDINLAHANKSGIVKGIAYVADFQYDDNHFNWRTVVEDVKGVRTAVYLMKKKLFLAKYPKCIFLET